MDFFLEFLQRLGFWSLFFSCSLGAHSIVFVHIGEEIPQHLFTTVAQARLFNETCPIFVIANEEAIKKASSLLLNLNIDFVPCESLVPTLQHSRFKNHPGHEPSAYGLWRYSLERFFYLEEFIKDRNINDVFHLESDVMLYADLESLLPIFKKHYSRMIGATFEDDFRCVPGFLYISDLHAIKKLIGIFPECGKVGQSDMETLAIFKNQYHRILIDHLPTVLPEYILDHPLKAEISKTPSKEPECYSNHFDDFKVIFDAAALGVYLAGFDSRFHPPSAKPGIISQWNVFNPSFFIIDWKVDDRGRKIPMISYKKKQMRGSQDSDNQINGNTSLVNFFTKSVENLLEKTQNSGSPEEVTEQIPIVNLHITNKSVINFFYSLN